MMSQSVTTIKKQLSKQPNNILLLGQLAEAYRLAGKLPLALMTYTQLLQIDPNNYQVLNNLGTLQRNLSDIESSVKTLLKANQIFQNSPIILTNLSETFLAMGRPDLAIEFCYKAVKIQPHFFDSNKMLGNAYIAAGEYEKAATSYKQALTIQDDNQVTISLARSYHLSGDNNRAYKIIKPLLKINSPSCAALFFNISKSIDKQDEAIKYLLKIIKITPNAIGQGAASLQFCLGKYYNEAGQFDDAINAYHKANKLCNLQYDITETRSRFSKIIDAFPNNKVIDLKDASNCSIKPIFILGMPRSGTTLVEQILASIPGVYGAGELNFIHILVHEIEIANNGLFTAFANLDPESCDILATKYLNQINSLAKDSKHVTDKMPHNFRYIGLLFKLFPSAHIIHCNRHPLDTCLSCYFSEFGNDSHNYAYSLNNLGKYYIEYNRLMLHWQKVYGDRIHNIYYENLISDTEATCRKLLSYCELDWDKKCLQFYKTKRNVNTLSYDQVNKPIYTASMFKWKNYKNILGKLPDTLATISKKYENKLNIK